MPDMVSFTHPLADQEAALLFPLKNLVLRKENVRSGELPDMTELINSIRSEGIIEPLIAAPVLDENGNTVFDKYELIAGNRRYWAAKELGLKAVPVRLIAADDARRHRLALVENLQRADMNPLDKARGIQKLMELETLDQKDAAKALGFSSGFISQHLGLLKLPKPVQDLIQRGKLELSYARQIGRLPSEEEMVELAKEASHLSITELQLKVDKAVLRAEEKANAPPRKPRSQTPEEDEEGDRRMTRAEFYAEAELAPLTKTGLRDYLVEYGNKLDRAESEQRQLEYRFILKGLAIAAGVRPK